MCSRQNVAGAPAHKTPSVNEPCVHETCVHKTCFHETRFHRTIGTRISIFPQSTLRDEWVPQVGSFSWRLLLNVPRQMEMLVQSKATTVRACASFTIRQLESHKLPCFSAMLSLLKHIHHKTFTGKKVYAATTKTASFNLVKTEMLAWEEQLM